MAAEKKRRSTRLGMGAVTPAEDPPPRAPRARGIDCPSPRATEHGTGNRSGIRPRTRVMEKPEEHADTMPAPPPAKPSVPRDARLASQASPKRVAAAELTTHEAFVLGMIDGTLTVEDLVDASAMAEEDAVAIVERLVALGLVAAVGPTPRS